MTCVDDAEDRGVPGAGPGPRALSQPVLPLARTGVDRAAEHRTDEAWLAAAWSHPDSRVLVVAGGKALVIDHDAVTDLVLVPAFEAPDGGERYFLGVDGAGVAYFALAVEALPGRLDGDARPAGLREVALLLGDRDSGLMVHAVALENWHRMHRFCARCGKATQVASAGHVRRCPACGAEHYPRTDPAVIMLVTDDEDRCLLGNHALWPRGRFSTLAGFVEPGESLEQAVRREVAEEAGIRVGEVGYVGSQPHPFPSSLMLGFMARAVSTDIDVDGEEMAEARWFSREELGRAVGSGEVIPPNEMSIARRLVELWYGEPLPRP